MIEVQAFLVPPFVPSGAVDGIVALGATFALMTIAWLTLIAFAVDRAGALLRRSWIRRTLDAILGTVFVFLGWRVATSAR